MGKKAPFWIYVEELAEKLKKGAHPLSFAEIKQIADRDWPSLSIAERERYKKLSRQDRVVLPVIRYEPPPPPASQQQGPDVPAYAHVLSKYFTLVDTAAETSITEGGEIALASFTLRRGIEKFLSAHLLPPSANTEPVRLSLQLPIIQQSSIIISSASDILNEVSQFCSREQGSAGTINLFADKNKVDILRKVFNDISERNESSVSISVQPIGALFGAIQVALAHETAAVDMVEVNRIADDVLRKSAIHARVPCSRHKPTDMSCAHGGVSALAFAFINAFAADLKQLGVDTSGGYHFLQPKSSKKSPNAVLGQTAQPTTAPPTPPEPEHRPDASDSMAVVPGPVIFVPGKGRLRTVAKIVPWRACGSAGGDGESDKAGALP